MEAVRKITGDYIAGFVDGEGCFSLTYRKDKQKYFYWKVSFSIVLRKDDREVLESIRDYFQCGKISFTNESIRFEIQDPDTLNNKLIPFFEQHQLIGKKKSDFVLWREAVQIVVNNKRKSLNSTKGHKGFIRNDWAKDDLIRLGQIRNSMQLYKGGGKTRIFKHAS
jgi:hypothetical protein